MKRKTLTTSLSAFLPLAAAVPLLLFAFWMLSTPESNADTGVPSGQVESVEPRAGLLDSQAV